MDLCVRCFCHLDFADVFKERISFGAENENEKIKKNVFKFLNNGILERIGDHC